MSVMSPKHLDSHPHGLNGVTKKLQTIKASPGSELGKDLVSISKDFAKGTTAGSVSALSNAKESAKVDQAAQQENTPAVDQSNRVTPTKAVATDTRSQNQKNSQAMAVSKGAPSAQAIKTCPACKGIGCPNCKPELAAVFTQEEHHRIENIKEVAKAKIVQKKENEWMNEEKQVTRLKKINAKNTANRIVRYQETLV